MRKLLLFCMLIAVSAAGCSRNYYNVPADSVASSMKVLGIAPLIVDESSDIRYPQKEELTRLLADINRKNEGMLVRKLKETGSFYTVNLLEGEPREIFGRLYSRRERRDDATVIYNKYFWKTDELRSVIQKNNLDALMLVVIGGLTRSGKESSELQLKSLTTDFNYLIMTAQVVDANGTVLWEYPNFRQRFLNFEPLLNLEYPDFSEADANLSSNVTVKFKTIDGVKKALETRRKDWLQRETQEPEIYARAFEDMVNLLYFEPAKKSPQPPADAAQPAGQQTTPAPEAKPASAAPQPAAQPAPPVPAAAPAASTPAKEAPAAEKAAPAPSDEIVPAKESTL